MILIRNSMSKNDKILVAIAAACGLIALGGWSLQGFLATNLPELRFFARLYATDVLREEWAESQVEVALV